MSLKTFFSNKAAAAMLASGIPAECPPNVNYSSKRGFGDLQINGAMGAAKRMGVNPRALAEQILAHLELDGICDKVELAGPGFINLHLNSRWFSEYVGEMAKSERLGVSLAAEPRHVVADYSSPNLAKEMHVGHLRGTVIGDAVVRVLEFLGHRVTRQNHIGDWGTQFGMLIAELDASDSVDTSPEVGFDLKHLEGFYQRAKAHFDADPVFADKARQNVVKLQSGDADCIALWRKFIGVSLEHAQCIYDDLGVSLRPEDVRGESAYNDDLAPVVEALQQQGLCTEDQGAQVVFLEELADKNGKPSPVIIQKADGGYLYATSDIAAIRYRVGELNADRILYFIDQRQSLHMKQVFAVGRKAKWVPDATELTHCAYGTMMGADGKPFKTRSGDTVKLAELLKEAVERADQVLVGKGSTLDVEERQRVAKAVGIGAVKYADLSITRTNDYVFDWDNMLSFEGNTAPYLQYAFTRIQSIFRQAGTEYDKNAEISIDLIEPAEHQLAITLGQFGDVVEQVAEKAYPHELCTYLFELAGRFMSFYEQCPILKDSVSNETRESRLQLSALTARVIQQGLGLLGIETLERM